MSDIFLSYEHSDLAKAEQLAAVLEAEGWSVWWDPKIPFGKRFPDVITQELDAAKCVIVLWSRASVKSTWVAEEAHEANRRGILIPVEIEKGITAPFGFRLVEAAKLSDWHGEPNHSEFKKLKSNVATTLGHAPRHTASTEPPERSLGGEGPPTKLNDFQIAKSTRRFFRGWPGIFLVVTTILAIALFNPILRRLAGEFFQSSTTQSTDRPRNTAGLPTDAGTSSEQGDPKGGTANEKPPDAGGMPASTKRAVPTDTSAQGGNDSKHNGPRVSDDGMMISDPTHGLIWTRNGNGRLIKWPEAEAYCGNLRLGNWDDWRIPRTHELKTLQEALNPFVSPGNPFQLTTHVVWSMEVKNIVKGASPEPKAYDLTEDMKDSIYNVSDSAIYDALCVRKPAKR